MALAAKSLSTSASKAVFHPRGSSQGQVNKIHISACQSSSNVSARLSPNDELRVPLSGNGLRLARRMALWSGSLQPQRNISSSAHLCGAGKAGLHASWQGSRSPSDSTRARTVCQVAGAAVPGEPIDFSTEATGHATTEKVSLGRKVRALCFYLWTFFLAIPLFISMLIMHPFVILLDKVKRRAHHFVNVVWATVTMALFYKVEIKGRENLPPPGGAAVYVANHQSFLDIFTLFALERPFKFISKTENFIIPLIGWSMFLTGHVPLKRMDSRSQRECLMACLNLLKQGASVLFFPEGTRTKDGKMHAFKKGAFSIAAKAKVPVIPISLIGTGHLMPNTMEGTLRPGKVTVVIHPPIQGTNADELCDKSRAAIAETLVSYGLGVH